MATTLPEVTPSGKLSTTDDSSWIRRSFMLSAKDIRSADVRWRTMTYAQQKFVDTRLGGNFAINPLPQYTSSADIKVIGIRDRTQKGAGGYDGMGEFYSDQIDNNQQLVHLSFGVPEFNGMITFFTSFFNQDAALLANEGRASISYYLGRAAGFVVAIGTLMAHPWLCTGAFAARFFTKSPSSKYYYFKETMPLYWNRVNMIANQIAVNMGIVPRVYLDDRGSAVEDERIDRNDLYITYAHRVAPDIFREGGGIDVYAVANRAQRLADARYNDLLELGTVGGTPQQIKQKLEEYITSVVSDKAENPSIEKYLDRYHRLAIGDKAHKRQDAISNRLSQDASTVEAEKVPGSEGSATPDYGPQGLRPRYIPNDVKDGTEKVQDGYAKEPGILDYWMANRRDGSQFVTFRTDYGGSMSESFTNNVTESQIQQTFNGMAGASKNAHFSFSGGETGIGMIDAVKQSVMDFVKGGLESIQLSGLMALAGQAFVDIPKHWESSMAQLPTAQYTIELRSWSGNKLARFLNMYVPLSCLLAAVLPLSTGRQSYSAPFICQCFCRGRAVIRLGMITSLQITRFTGNMGASRNGDCLGIDISFEVTDMSSLMHAPIDVGNPVLQNAAKVGGAVAGGVGGAAAGSVLGPGGTIVGGAIGAEGGAFLAEGVAKLGNGILDEDNPFNDYMAVLSNLSTADMIYPFRKLSLNMTRAWQAFDTHFTKAHFASAMDEYWPTRTLGHAVGIFTRSSEKLTVQ